MDKGSKARLFTSTQESHILGTFRHIDGLLSTIEATLAGDGSALFPIHRPDITPEQRERMLACLRDFGRYLACKTQEYGFEFPGPRSTASHAISSTLTFVDIAAAELRPSATRGYGQLSEAATKELDRLVSELQALTVGAERVLKADRQELAS